MRLFGSVLTDGAELTECLVVLQEGRIVSVEPNMPDARDIADRVVTEGWIAPGFVDMQVNGAGGADLTGTHDPDQAVQQVARMVAQHGTTSFCPTVVSAPREAYRDRIRAYGPRSWPGAAESLGAHLEGPFLNPAFRGVHDLAALRHATRDELQAWLSAGPFALVTLAPEMPGGMEAVRLLHDGGVLVSVGHSGAGAAEANDALQAGARMGTHLFNAMPPLHHREPGLVGALLASSAVVGLIADGAHVDPLVVEIVVRAAGPERVALVSDALAPAGGPPGASYLGQQAVWSDGRAVRRADGTLAGSALLQADGLRNLHRWLPWLPPARLVQMATSTPAGVLGSAVAVRKGRIAPGWDADLVVLAPDFAVRDTYVRGVVVGGSAPPESLANGEQTRARA